ncbi:unnamed protein product [Gordionus sp. m RMFG-2023]|uniref:NSFL1 cofactor p47-like isoform X2 n=1 Tax=Gordionus sp. m RMFG-2023 TaxID=3053472 RepID=UPI0030E3EACC
MSDLVTKFTELTNCKAETALSYLSKYEWILEDALYHYFEEVSDKPENKNSNSSEKTRELNKSAGHVDKNFKINNTSNIQKEHKIQTLDSILKDNKNEDEGAQAFYAGGSDKSGQLILGPSSFKDKKGIDNAIENIFKTALDNGAKEINPSALTDALKNVNPSSIFSSNKKAFSGKGYVLGGDHEGQQKNTDDSTPMADDSLHLETADDIYRRILSSSAIPASQRPNDNSCIVLRLWRDGFTIDTENDNDENEDDGEEDDEGEGDLRSYSNPENQEFLNSVLRSEIPPELSRKMAGRHLNLIMEDHRTTDFEGKTTKKSNLFNSSCCSTSAKASNRKTKPFTGAGHILGSPSPSVITATSSVSGILKGGNHQQTLENATLSEFDVNKPATKIQIRLEDGTKLSLKCNLQHTIGDIRKAIVKYIPKYDSVVFKLLVSFPKLNLDDDNLTIEQANLINSVIIQKIIS